MEKTSTHHNERSDFGANDISTIKKIFAKNKMDLIVGSEDIATDTYFKPLAKDDVENGSHDSNDTRYMLDKQQIDIISFLLKMGAKLEYIGSGATGHTFRGDITQDGKIVYQFALKAAAYPKRETYGDTTNIMRPENAEIMMLRVLSYFVINKQTPHLLLPLKTFDTGIDFFILLDKHGFIKHNVQKYKDFIKKHADGKYENTMSVLMSEWANRGDFLSFIKTRYRKIELVHWKVFFFQIISVLAVIQSKYPAFRHNDMKANNILVQTVSKRYDTWAYKVCNKRYIVPNIGYQIKLWDFDFACIKGIVDNVKVNEEWTREINITSNKNKYYDIHYFFNTLMKFFPNIIDDKTNIPLEVSEFVRRIVPSQYSEGTYVNQKGRILSDIEFTTPQIILESDPFFGSLRDTQRKIN